MKTLFLVVKLITLDYDKIQRYERRFILKPTVIVANHIENPALEKLEANFNVTFFHSLADLKDPDFLEDLKIVEGIIGFSIELDAEFLDLAPNLIVICIISVGYNYLNINELSIRGILIA